VLYRFGTIEEQRVAASGRVLVKEDDSMGQINHGEMSKKLIHEAGAATSTKLR
jgi:hypothetical protein